MGASDDQRSTPTEPFAVWPQPEPHTLQPYPQPAPPPVAYGHEAGVPVGGGFTNTAVVAPRVGAVHVVIAWVFAALTLGYFLAWAIAATRQKSNTLAIGLLNLLVGWTLIGWIAAMVMAVQTEPIQVTNVAYAVAPVVHVGPQTAPPGWYPDQLGTRRTGMANDGRGTPPPESAHARQAAAGKEDLQVLAVRDRRRPRRRDRRSGTNQRCAGHCLRDS